MIAIHRIGQALVIASFCMLGPVACVGSAGPQGDTGAPGVSCWDLNANGACDTAAEDRDGDGQCTAADCSPSLLEAGYLGSSDACATC
ncbi:MAG: hypothetical protein D6806_14045, partial [Deltaproteobacteria bacterium]